MNDTTEQIERLFALLRRARRYWIRAFVVGSAVVAIGLTLTLMRPRRWVSETVVLYRETMRSSDVSGIDVGANNNARSLGPRLREMLMSRAELEPIINEFKLYPDVVYRRGLVDAVDEMRKYVQFRVREGDTFAISFEAGSPKQAQQVTERLGRCIVDYAAKHRTAQAKLLSDFLGSESTRYSADLRDKEAALARFLANNPSFVARAAAAAQGRPEPELTSAAAANANPPRSSDAKLAALEARASRIERRLRGSFDGPAAPKGLPVPKSPGTPRAAEESPELAAARRDLSDKLAHFTDKHPDVLAARARVRELEEAAARKRSDPAPGEPSERLPAGQPAPTLSDEARAQLTAELASLKAQMEQRRQTLTEMGVKVTDPSSTAVNLEVEFGRLLREVQQARERYAQLEDREFRARLAASSVEDDRNIQVSILDPAFLPTHPSGRGRMITMLIVLALAGVLSLGVGVGSALIDDRIYEKQDLVLLLPEVRLIGVIPAAQTGSRRTQ